MKMANWEKLNKEFETALSNLTDEQFAFWNSQKESKKKMRRTELEMSAKIQAQKLALEQPAKAITDTDFFTERSKQRDTIVNLNAEMDEDEQN